MDLNDMHTTNLMHVFFFVCLFDGGSIYRYNLNTALYMLQPWERCIFNTIVLCVLAYIVYGVYYTTLHPLLERLASSHM